MKPSMFKAHPRRGDAPGFAPLHGRVIVHCGAEDPSLLNCLTLLDTAAPTFRTPCLTLLQTSFAATCLEPSARLSSLDTEEQCFWTRDNPTFPLTKSHPRVSRCGGGSSHPTRNVTGLPGLHDTLCLLKMLMPWLRDTASSSDEPLVNICSRSAGCLSTVSSEA